MKKREQLPKYLKPYFGTLRGFKQAKRTEWGYLNSWLRTFGLASAFLPPDTYELFIEAERALKEMSGPLKKWWRKA